MKLNLRFIYLYLFSFVGLLIVVIGGIRMVDLGIKTFIFKDADKYEIYQSIEKDGVIEISIEEQQARQERELKRQKQRELSGALSMMVIGLPLYLYHWKIIQKNKE